MPNPVSSRSPLRLVAAAVLGGGFLCGFLPAAWAAGPVKIAADEHGFKHFSVDGKDYVPIGVNYMLSHQGPPYKTFDTFDTKDFHADEIDQDLKAIAGAGFNFVRLWLKGLDTDDGFSLGPHQISPAYVDNVYKTMHAARAVGLRVVLTGSFPKSNWVPANYLPTGLPGDDAVGGMNRLILLPEMAEATGDFFRDLLQALQAKDPNVLNAIFYLDLMNEFHFSLDAPPFSKFSGQYRYRGKDYDLSSGASRQALMDDAAEAWLRTVKAKVTAVKPDLLVTASSFFLLAVNHNSFDGGALTSKGDKANPNFPLRPSAVLRGGADIIDVHVYPGPARPNLPGTHVRFDAIMHASEITESTARDAPIIAGEFGADKQKFATAADAPEELLADEQVFCRYHVTGFAAWMWKGTGDTWMLTDEPLMRAFAPKYNPEFCGHKVVAL